MNRRHFLMSVPVFAAACGFAAMPAGHRTPSRERHIWFLPDKHEVLLIDDGMDVSLWYEGDQIPGLSIGIDRWRFRGRLGRSDYVFAVRRESGEFVIDLRNA